MTYLKNKKRLLFYTFLISITIIFYVFTEMRFYGIQLDFYWNFNFGLQISKGLLPYRDFNIVITPLLAYLTGIFLHFFGKTILSYSIFMAFLKVLLTSLISIIAVKISNLKNASSKDKLFFLTFFIVTMLLYFRYFDYNYLAILFLILTIYLENSKLKEIKKDFFIGILASFSLLSKQSIGLFVIIFAVIHPIIFKKNIKKSLIRVGGILLPSSIFLLQLIFSNSLYSFIDYCILGLSDFSSNTISFIESFVSVTNNGYLNFSIPFITVLIFSIIYLIYKIYKILKNKKNYSYEYKNVLYYSISALSCFYPIMDITHLLPSILPLIILISISLFNIMKKYCKFNKIILNCISLVIVIIYIEIMLFPIGEYFKVVRNANENKTVLTNCYPLNGLVVNKSTKENITTMTNFIKESDKKVIFLDNSAVIYHLPLDIYYKDYDLFMRGNFGKNGEDRLIEEIKESKDTIYLINPHNKNEQTPKKVKNYVIENFEKVGNILKYDIYSKRSSSN